MKNGCLDCLLLVLFTLCTGWATAADVWIDLEKDRTFYTPGRVTSADLDGDGLSDLITSTTGSGDPTTCSIWWSDGDRTSLTSTLSDNEVFRLLAIDDLNNDGYKDLIYMPFIYYYQGDHKFIKENVNFTYGTKFGDVNHDGRLDHIYTSKWVDGSNMEEHEFSYPIKALFLADMNNDKKLDLICYYRDWDTSEFFWLENTGEESSFMEKHDISDYYSIKDTFDYDYDGDDDLYVWREGVAGFMRNNEGLIDAEFIPLFDATSDDFFYRNQIIDIDFDGDWDLIGLDFNEKRFFLIEQLGYRSLIYEKKWISEVEDVITDAYYEKFSWVYLFQTKDSTFFFYQRRYTGNFNSNFDESLSPPASYETKQIRVPVIVQPENSVPGMNWSLYQ